VTRLGVRAFRTIYDLFELQDNVGVGDLDLRVAAATWGLESVVRSSLSRRSRFEFTKAATAAANPNNTTLSFRSTSNWDQIWTTEGNGVAVQTNHTLRVMGIGVFLGTPANFTDATLMQKRGSLEIPWATWDAELDGRALLNGLDGFYGPIPFEVDGLQYVTVFETNVSGNTDVTLIADVISGPEGLFGTPASL